MIAHDYDSMHPAGRIIEFMVRRSCPALLTVLLLGACGHVASGPAPLPKGVASADPVIREAIETAWATTHASPSSAEAWLQLALLLDGNGFDTSAATAWTTMESLAPSDGRPPYFLALQAAEQGNWDAALERMQRVRTLAPNHSPAAWRAGFWLLDLGDAQAARALFQRALGTDPTAAAASIGIARADLALDRTNAAITRLSELASQTGHPYTIYLLGQALRRGGRGDEAASLPITGTPAVPRFPDAWNAALLDAQRGLDGELARADRLLEDGRVDDASLAIKRALVIWPDHVHLLNRLGEVHRRNNDATKWARTLQRAVRLDPESFQSQLNLSMALRSTGDLEQALRAAVIAAGLQPDVPEGHLQVARMHLLAKRPIEAIAAMEQAFALGVTDPREHVQFAAALLQAHRADEAIARLDDVLKRTPTLPNGWIVMAKAHAVAGRPQIAMEAAKAGLRHNPGHPQLRQLSSDLSRGAQGRSNQENDT